MHLGIEVFNIFPCRHGGTQDPDATDTRRGKQPHEAVGYAAIGKVRAKFSASGNKSTLHRGKSRRDRLSGLRYPNLRPVTGESPA